MNDPATKAMQEFFMTAIELYNAGYTEMEIDYRKKDGSQDKLKLTISESSHFEAKE